MGPRGCVTEGSGRSGVLRALSGEVPISEMGGGCENDCLWSVCLPVGLKLKLVGCGAFAGSGSQGRPELLRSQDAVCVSVRWKLVESH